MLGRAPLTQSADSVGRARSGSPGPYQPSLLAFLQAEPVTPVPGATGAFRRGNRPSHLSLANTECPAPKATGWDVSPQDRQLGAVSPGPDGTPSTAEPRPPHNTTRPPPPPWLGCQVLTPFQPFNPTQAHGGCGGGCSLEQGRGARSKDSQVPLRGRTQATWGSVLPGSLPQFPPRGFPAWRVGRRASAGTAKWVKEHGGMAGNCLSGGGTKGSCLQPGWPSSVGHSAAMVPALGTSLPAGPSFRVGATPAVLSVLGKEISRNCFGASVNRVLLPRGPDPPSTTLFPPNCRASRSE